MNAAGSYCDVVGCLDRAHRADRQHAPSLRHHRAGEGADRPHAGAAGRARPLFARLSARGDERRAGRALRDGDRACLLGRRAAALGFRERARRRPSSTASRPFLERAGERLPLFGRAGLKIGRFGRHHAYAGWRLSLRPRARPAELLDALRRLDRHLPGRRARANISRNGWCMARPRSTCASSTRAASATGRPRTTPRSLGRRLPAHVLLLQAGRAARGWPRSAQDPSLHGGSRRRGAQFAQVFGWERARWYDPRGEGEAFSFKRSNWWERGARRSVSRCATASA